MFACLAEICICESSKYVKKLIHMFYIRPIGWASNWHSYYYASIRELYKSCTKLAKTRMSFANVCELYSQN